MDSARGNPPRAFRRDGWQEGAGDCRGRNGAHDARSGRVLSQPGPEGKGSSARPEGRGSGKAAEAFVVGGWQDPGQRQDLHPRRLRHGSRAALEPRDEATAGDLQQGRSAGRVRARPPVRQRAGLGRQPRGGEAPCHGRRPEGRRGVPGRGSRSRIPSADRCPLPGPRPVADLGGARKAAGGEGGSVPPSRAGKAAARAGVPRGAPDSAGDCRLGGLESACRREANGEGPVMSVVVIDDTEAVRAHVQLLRAYGASYREIAAAAGIRYATTGGGGKLPEALTEDTASAPLAGQPRPLTPPRVPPTGGNVGRPLPRSSCPQ